MALANLLWDHPASNCLVQAGQAWAGHALGQIGSGWGIGHGSQA